MRIYFLLLTVSVFVWGCMKDTNRNTTSLPVVTTSSVGNITLTSGSSGGNVTDDGGDYVTSRGVCWSVSQGPTISNAYTVDGASIGAFTSQISGLNSGTTYYVRAYATNGLGTSYGNEISFNTTPANVYIGGCTDRPSYGKPAVWINGSLNLLPVGGNDAMVRDLFIEGNDVYAAGSMFTNTNPAAIYWKNANMTSLTNGAKEGSANRIAVSGTDVYIAGVDDGPAMEMKGFLWHNNSATLMSTNPNNSTSFAAAVAISGNDVYVGTTETDWTTFQDDSYLWKNGSVYSAMPTLPWKIVCSGVNVFVTFYKEQIDPFVWKDGQLITFPAPSRGAITSIFPVSNDLYACGYILNGTVKKAVFWKNGIVTELTDGIHNATATDLAVVGQDVYVVYNELISQTLQHPYVWKNGVKTLLATNGFATSLVVK